MNKRISGLISVARGLFEVLVDKEFTSSEWKIGAGGILAGIIILGIIGSVC